MAYGAVVRAYDGGLRVSVRDELDDDFLLDALRSVLRDGANAEAVGASTSRTRPRRCSTFACACPARVASTCNTGARLLRPHAPAAGLSRWSGPATRGRRRPRDRRSPHGRGHDDRAFGEALDQALGDRRGLTRYGEARVPMDEALAHAVVDLSGRATATDLDLPRSGHGRPRLPVTRPDRADHAARDRDGGERPPRRRGRLQGRRSRAGSSAHPRRLARPLDQGLAVSDVVVVDYGAGNTRSVRAALSHLGRDERRHAAIPTRSRGATS